MIKIQPSSDYVQLIYVDAVSESVQEELKSDSDAIEYSSGSNGKIYLQFGRMTFEDIDPTEFEINGVAVTDAVDFITKLTALFSSPGGCVTIYTGDGSLLTPREIDMNGNSLEISQGDKYFLQLDPTVNNEIAAIQAYNTTGLGNYAYLRGTTTDQSSQASLASSFNGSSDNYIQLSSSITGSQLSISSPAASISAPITLNGRLAINSDTGALFEGHGDSISWVFDDSAQTVVITAPNGTFLPLLAGGGITGLSIDNDGKIIRTP